MNKTWFKKTCGPFPHWLTIEIRSRWQAKLKVTYFTVLCNFITSSLSAVNKDVGATFELFVMSIHTIGLSPISNHGEADTRIYDHVADAFKKGRKNVYVQIIDTDVFFILIS